MLQEAEATALLEHMKDIHKAAVEAVALGDNTLKEAKNTYETLAGFQSQVQESSKKADDALSTVPAIRNQIENAVSTVDEAENVSITSVDQRSQTGFE